MLRTKPYLAGLPPPRLRCQLPTFILAQDENKPLCALRPACGAPYQTVINEKQVSNPKTSP